MTGGALVVGLGRPDRGDDAVGVLVARQVRARGLPGVVVLEETDPTDLVEAWTGHDLVVVVDAVCSGRECGEVLRLETGSGRAPLPPSTWAGTGRTSSHAFGVGGAVELARVLGRLPRRLVLLGVEAGSFTYGAPVAPAVASAVDRVAALVAEEVTAGVSR